jgi:hypothetical protein
MRFLSMFCAVVLVTPVAGRSQVYQPGMLHVDAGSRVRIAAPAFGPEKRVGTVMSLARDTLVFRYDAQPGYQSVPTSEITTLEVSSGRHSRKAKATLIGMVLGAGIAAGIQAATWKRTTSFDFGRGGDAALAAVPGALAGGMIGLLVGAHQTESWAPVNLPRR